jgi:hypothetical protein
MSWCPVHRSIPRFPPRRGGAGPVVAGPPAASPLNPPGIDPVQGCARGRTVIARRTAVQAPVRITAALVDSDGRIGRKRGQRAGSVPIWSVVTTVCSSAQHLGLDGASQLPAARVDPSEPHVGVDLYPARTFQGGDCESMPFLPRRPHQRLLLTESAVGEGRRQPPLPPASMANRRRYCLGVIPYRKRN